MEANAKELQDQAERNEMLAWACARGLHADVATLVSQGAAVNGRDRRGRTAAHFAAARAHANVLEYLAGRGADLEAEDARGRTPVHYAALSDVAADAALRTAAEHERRAAAALAATTAPDAAAAAADAAGGPDLLDDRTPMQRAQAAALGARGSGSEAIALLARRAPAWVLDAADGADDTPLHLACRHGAADAARALLAAGCRASLSAVNKRGLTPLAEAIAGGHLGCAAALVAEGADVSARVDGGRFAGGGKGGGGGKSSATTTSSSPTSGFTLLHVAAASGQADSVQYLLDCFGADGASALLEDAANEGAATPLHAAAAAGAASCAELLLRAGADWRAEASGGLLAADMVPDNAPRAEALREMLQTGEVPSSAAAAASRGGGGGSAAAGGGAGIGGWLGGLLSSSAGGAGAAAGAAVASTAKPEKKGAATKTAGATAQVSAGGGAKRVADAAAKATTATTSTTKKPPSSSTTPTTTTTSAPKTLPEQVRGLPTPQERARRVEALARGTPDDALDALVRARELTEPQAEALRALRRVSHVLAASRLVRMVRRDEGFQDDATDPAAVAALHHVRAGVAAAAAASQRAASAPASERAAAQAAARAAAEAARKAEDHLLRGETADPAAASVAAKLRSLHARLREEAGGLRVTIEDLVNVPPSVRKGSAEAQEMRERALKDADERVAEFEKAVEAARVKAVAALVGGEERERGEEKAAAAAGGEEKEDKEQEAAAAAAAPDDDDNDAEDNPLARRLKRQQEEERELREGAAREAAAVGAGDAAATVVAAAPPPAADADAQPADLPWREQFWLSFRESSLRALKAIAMTVLMVLLLWATGTLPGQEGTWVERLRDRLLEKQQQAAAAAASAGAAGLAAGAGAAAAAGAAAGAVGPEGLADAAAAAAAALPGVDGHDEF